MVNVLQYETDHAFPLLLKVPYRGHLDILKDTHFFSSDLVFSE